MKNCKTCKIQIPKHKEFCSLDCWYQFRHRSILKITTCKLCGKNNETNKNHNRQFCSRKCSQIYHKAKKDFSFCKFCGKKFEKPIYFDGYFCSLQCYHSQLNYEKTQRIKLNKVSQLPAEIRIPILTRDNYICFICDKYGNHVHHIDYNQINNHEKNLITLCVNDHARTNRNRGLWEIYFFNRLQHSKKQQIIIIEGPDNSGKSSIAKILHKHLKIPLFKNKEEKELFIQKDFENEMKYMPQFICSFLMQVNVSVIFDRQYPSHYVYSKVKKERFNRNEFWKTDKLFSYLNTKIIICFKTIHTKKDELIPNFWMNSLIEEYKRFAKYTNCHTLLLDTTDENLEHQITQILNFLKETSA